MNEEIKMSCLSSSGTRYISEPSNSSAYAALTAVPLTDGPRKSAWLDQIRQKLESVRRLPRNWDRENGDPIDPQIINTASELLLPLATLAPPLPVIAPILGGGMQFIWEVGERALEVEILPDRSVEYLLIEGINSEEHMLEDDGPAEIERLVRWLLQH
ncbi:MAG TPA: hypothetical protein VFV34_13120 [Blastocatellia bacterium]|nr:hypothetical protein [Blastocatellia bacterium]